MAAERRPESLRITAVVGTVRDKDGDPVAGVSVKAGGAETTTGEAGTYRLDAAAGPGLVVRFDKAAFLPGIKRVDVQESTATALDVVLLMENTPATMSADLGGQAVRSSWRRREPSSTKLARP